MAKPGMTKTQQILVVVAVTMISLYFFLSKVHDPLSEELKAAIEKNNTLVEAINELNKEPVTTAGIQKSIKKLTPEVSELEAELKKLQASVLTPGDIVEEIIMRVNEIASNNGLLVKELVPVKAGDAKLSPGALKEQKEFDRSCYRMKISGDFIDFYTFVRELNTIEYLVNIANFSVESAGEAGRVNVDMLVII